MAQVPGLPQDILTDSVDLGRVEYSKSPAGKGLSFATCEGFSRNPRDARIIRCPRSPACLAARDVRFRLRRSPSSLRRSLLRRAHCSLPPMVAWSAVPRQQFLTSSLDLPGALCATIIHDTDPCGWRNASGRIFRKATQSRSLRIAIEKLLTNR